MTVDHYTRVVCPELRDGSDNTEVPSGGEEGDPWFSLRNVSLRNRGSPVDWNHMIRLCDRGESSFGICAQGPYRE